MSLPAERRRALQVAGLRGVLKRRAGPEVAGRASIVAFGGGAALIDPEQGLAAVFSDGPASLGPAIDVAGREGMGRLLFFADGNDGAVARRAGQFAIEVEVLGPAPDFTPIVSAPAVAEYPRPDDLQPVEDRLRAAGLEPVWEHGVLTGEWLGLEVARVEDGELRVGVGRHDREANVLLHPGGASDDELLDVVQLVRTLRSPGAAPHPGNQLVPERWLRAVLLGDPGLAGLPALTSAPPPDAREDLRRRGVAPARGDGVVAVCSVGMDPALAAEAADARAQIDPAAELVIVVPEGDDHPMTRRLAGLLRQPGEVRTVPPGWRKSAP
jgi:hypothetical protein